MRQVNCILLIFLYVMSCSPLGSMQGPDSLCVFGKLADGCLCVGRLLPFSEYWCRKVPRPVEGPAGRRNLSPGRGRASRNTKTGMNIDSYNHEERTLGHTGTHWNDAVFAALPSPVRSLIYTHSVEDSRAGRLYIAIYIYICNA